MGIVWQGLIHDLSKFSKAEWTPYMDYFQGKPGDQSLSIAAFERAWSHHKWYNPHHWEHWIVCGGPLPMPEVYVKEMIVDWIAAGLAGGHGNDLIPWYESHKDKIKLHDDTRRLVEGFVYEPVGK
jgi:hypothetical protein